MPRNARSRRSVRRRVLLRRVEVEVLAAADRVRAGDLAARALAVEDRVLEDLAVARRRSRASTQSSCAVAGDAWRAACRTPTTSRRGPGRETKRRLAFCPTTSSTTVLNRPSAAESYCSQTSASAPSSRTMSTRQFSAVSCWAWIAVSSDRRVEPRVARDVDERAALPLRRVARDEGVVARRDDRAEVRVDEVAVRLDRLRERHDERTVGRDGSTVRPGVVDLAQLDGPGGDEHRLGLGGEVAAGRRRERREVELASSVNSQPGCALEVGQREVPPGGRCGTSQWSPPSGARSGGSSRPRTPSGAP